MKYWLRYIAIKVIALWLNLETGVGILESKVLYYVNNIIYVIVSIIQYYCYYILFGWPKHMVGKLVKCYLLYTI